MQQSSVTHAPLRHLLAGLRGSQLHALDQQSACTRRAVGETSQEIDVLFGEMHPQAMAPEATYKP